MRNPFVLVAWSEPHALGTLLKFLHDFVNESYGNQRFTESETMFLGPRRVSGADGMSEIRLAYTSADDKFHFDCKVEISPCSSEFPSLQLLPAGVTLDGPSMLTLQSFSDWARAVDENYPHVLVGTGKDPATRFSRSMSASGVMGYTDVASPTATLFPRMLAPTPTLIAQLHSRFDALHPVLISGSDIGAKIYEVGVEMGYAGLMNLLPLKVGHVLQLNNELHNNETFSSECRKRDLLLG